MNKVNISDDERLITLTKIAYDKIQFELNNLEDFRKSKTLRIISDIKFYPFDWVDYSKPYIYDRSVDHYMLKRVHYIDVPYEVPGEYEPNSVLISTINNLLSDAKITHDEVYKEILVKLDELNKMVSSSREELAKNKQESERIIASIPKFLKFIYKLKTK